MYNSSSTERNTEYWLLATCDGTDLRDSCPDDVKQAINDEDDINTVN